MTSQPRRRLDGLKVIAAYVQLSPRSCRKYASPATPLEWRMPLFRIAVDERNGRLSAYPDDLDEWVERFRARSLFDPRLPKPKVRHERDESRRDAAK